MTELSSKPQPIVRFYTRINDQDFLGITVWQGKTDPTAEIIVAQVRRRSGDNWETVGRLVLYRTREGTYSRLPDKK